MTSCSPVRGVGIGDRDIVGVGSEGADSSEGADGCYILIVLF